MSPTEIVDTHAREELEVKKRALHSISLKSIKETCDLNSKQIAALEQNCNRRIGDLEQHRGECDNKHETALQHRRKSDQEMSVIATTLQESLKVSQQMQETMTKLLSTVEKHAPTVERSSKTHITLDGMKALFIYVGCTSTAIIATKYILEFFQR